MGLYSSFSSYVERMEFKHATIRNVNDDSIDITVDEVDWDNIDWKYHCQGGYIPTSPRIPYSAGQTVSIEWDTFNEKPLAVIGFPDGANQCSTFGLLIHTDLPSPTFAAYRLEVWINGDPAIVTYWETELPGDHGVIIDDGPRNYRNIMNDVALAYQALDEYPGVQGKILDIQFAENYPYRIVMLVDRLISQYADEDDEMEYTHCVLTYTINPSTLELEWEDYWGLQAGPVGCQGGCSEAALLKNNPWCPGWTCECGTDGARSGCFNCSTSYYHESTVYSALTNTEYHTVDQLSSTSTGSCGGSCCGDCAQTYLPSKVHITENSDPLIFATGRRSAHVMVMPGGSRGRTYTWNHPASLTNLDTGYVSEGGIYKEYDETTQYQVTQEDRCFKARSRISYTLSGHYLPTGGNPFNHSYDSDWGESQYGIGNCYNAIGAQIMANLVRGDPSVFRCSYAHNLIGDHHKELPHIELGYWSQLAYGYGDEPRICLAPYGQGCGGREPSWSASFSLYLVLSDDSYYYSQFERYVHVDRSVTDDPDNNEFLGNYATIPPEGGGLIAPRWSLRQERPDVAVVWGDAALLHTIFYSYTTAFTGGLQEVRCKEGQTNPDCYHAIDQADIDGGHTYESSEIGEEREWSLLIDPSRAGWIISYRRTGTVSYEFRLYPFTDLEEDTPGSGVIVHGGSPSWYKAYSSDNYEPKGHAVCVYTP